jgi:cytochrome c oxidase subunit 3/cytochrome o ubiquinol oxidase subunit 3
MAAGSAARHGFEPVSAGRVGMIGLIAAESSLLAVFVVAYLFYLGKSLSGPTPQDVLRVPLVNTVCLLSSSATIALAVRGLRAGRERTAAGWLLVTSLLGLEFLLGTGREWYRLIVDEGLTIRTNLFGTTFYSLVGAHAAHVTLGLTMLAILLVCAARGSLRQAHAERVELVSWYWHFVDVVWLVVFTVVYIVGR